MGEIIRFRPRDGAKQTSSALVVPNGRSAEILLFLGVRYERHGDETRPGKRPATPRKGKARKRA